MNQLILLFTMVTVVLCGAGKAHAITPQEFFRIPFQPENFYRNFNLNFGFDLRYQIGDEWGKKPVTEADLNSDEHFRRMARATAKVRSGGTGFYLGYYNGHHIMATNHHVCPSATECMFPKSVQFPLLGFSVSVEEFYGSWPEIDLALFAIQVPDKTHAQALEEVGARFAFEQDLYRGEKLVTIGFGVADNPRRQMVANRDEDCIVYSGEGEYRLMADPDDLNPGDYKAWSFANGCDVSHGDSGSAMMDRMTGQIVGIIWTGRIPKSEKVQSSAYLRELLENPNEEIWKELSYGVPAVHMKPYLHEQIQKGSVDSSYVPTLEALLL